MIISCEKCNKKFELADNLIPETGRLLQCGSCSYQWHYTPKNKIELVNEVVDEFKILNENVGQADSIVKSPSKKKNQTYKNSDKLIKKEIIIEKEKIGFFSYLIVGIISLIALLILVDTFKSHISKIFPGIDYYLLSLYETLKDIKLFFKDLLK